MPSITALMLPIKDVIVTLSFFVTQFRAIFMHHVPVGSIGSLVCMLTLGPVLQPCCVVC